jgi:hypothetical protein
MNRIALVIATIVVTAAFGCGGRETGTGLDGTSGTNSSGASSAAGSGASAGTASGGSGSATGSAASGGGQCKIVDPSDYDQSCSFDTDCVIVPGGITSCPRCACGEAAVNARVQAQYNEDRALRWPSPRRGAAYVPT